MSDTPQTVGVAVIALALVRALETAIRALIEKKHDPQRNGKAGEKSPEFWEIKFRAIVEREVAEHVIPELRRIQERLELLIRGKRRQ